MSGKGGLCMALLPFGPFGSGSWEPAPWVVPTVLLVLALGSAAVLLITKPPRPVPPAEEDDDPFTFP